MERKRGRAWTMDRWKYYAVTHADHWVMNPLSEAKLARVLAFVDTGDTGRVLDIGCGKGALLRSLAPRCPKGQMVGVDRSPYFIREARRAAHDTAGRPPFVFKEMDGADYAPPEAHYFDLCACLGASWILGGYGGTLKSLARMTRPAGTVLVGEPFWKKPPPLQYLRAIGEKASAYATRLGNIRTARRQGLELVLSVESSLHEWDLYEGMQGNAARRYAHAHRDDPDVPEILERAREARDAYLRWGRSTLGWGVYVFRTPSRPGAVPPGPARKGKTPGRKPPRGREKPPAP